MPHQAYGDESAGEAFVCYGTFVAVVSNVQPIEQAVAAAIAARGVAESLHCRVLFNAEARKKSAWSALSMDDVFQLYGDLIQAVKPLIKRIVVALAEKSALPDEILGGQWEAADPNHVGPMNWARGWPFRDKQIASLCAMATMVPLSKWPGLGDLEFWPDPDSTVIEINGGRRKFAQTLGVFIDNQDGQEPAKIKVRYLDAGKPSLLQLADLIAYVGQRSARAKFSPLDQKFKALDKAIGAEIVRMGITPQGGIGFKIANDVLNRRGP